MVVGYVTLPESESLGSWFGTDNDNVCLAQVIMYTFFKIERLGMGKGIILNIDVCSNIKDLSVYI